MKRILVILLSIIVISSLAYAGPTIRDRTQEEIENILDNQHQRLKGILCLGFSIYFFYFGTQMLQGAKYEKGDVKLVGTCLIISSVPLLIYGIKLAF